MPITLLTGPANAGKAQVVMDAVRAHVARGEEPLLVVPTHADAEHYLRELAGEGVAMGTRVERFDGLIEEAVRRAGITAPVLGSLARRRLLATIAAADGATRGAPGFVAAIEALFAELRVRRVSPATLTRALGGWAEQHEAGASRVGIGRLFERYHAELAGIGRIDREQRAVAALDELRRTPARWGATPVLFYGFDDLTRLQLDAIETLGRVVGAKVTVSLTYEPGRTAFAGRAATFAALDPMADEHRRLTARAEYYAPSSRRALSHLERTLFEPEASREDSAGALGVLEGGGERAELELVAREIARLLGEGVPAEEVAVVVRSSPAGADLLEEVFLAAGIPYALQRRRRFGDTSVGRALIGLLRCVGEAPEGELGDLLAWLRAPGLIERDELVDRLELIARRTGVVSSERARAIWEERNWPLETLDELLDSSQRGPGALIDRAMRELVRIFAAPRRRSASVLAAEDVEEAHAFAAGRRALAELRELARLAPELAPESAQDLAQELIGLEFVGGERPAPGLVAVLDPLGLRARRVRALFLCGLQEGVFPARARSQPLLAEEERRELAEVSGLRLGEHEDVLAAERYLLYAAVSRPEELLVLSWHVSDDDGEPTARSLFVEDVCDLFEERLLESPERRPLGAVDWLGESHPERSEAPTTLRHERVLQELRAHVWSASSFETWIGCPVRWFVERLLRPGAIEPDGEPLVRGGLAHAVLKDTLEALRRETGSARIRPATLATARELLERAFVENEAEFPLSVAPERRPGALRRLRSDLGRYLEHAAESDSELEPSALELGFGFAAGDQRGPASTLAAFELGGGVRMRGRIDRVDVSETGEAVVYDYKARAAPPAAKWIGEGNLQVALYMRAVEDLLGVSAAGGFYQPLSGSDLRARGLLDGDSSVELECVRGDVREHDEVRELLDEALAGARGAAAQAAAGALEARPHSCAYNGGCRYPTICRCEP
ncbi:MAG TPA: PD-(D/E)XK nuclease family protein [Solirubrobacteraceae bacterium]|nr:PD-(D/E)XK nuclease family protein [Solirubrobacteraceae bacterium]